MDHNQMKMSYTPFKSHEVLGVRWDQPLGIAASNRPDPLRQEYEAQKV